MEDHLRPLPVMLTQDEFDQRAAELAAVNQEIAALAFEKKSMASDFKGKIENAQGRQSRLTDVVAKRSEIRDVGCTERIEPEKKIVEIVRMDTGEVVDTRSLTAKDIQESLSFISTDEESGKRRRKNGDE